MTLAGGRGFVLALSGIESSGKSTQRDLLLEHLRAQGDKVVCVWSRPGYSSRLRVGKALLRVLRGKKPRGCEHVSSEPGRYPRRAATLRNPLERWTWLTLALLDLLWVHSVQIRLLRAAGRVVVCDRHVLDFLVDFRVNFPEERVEQRWLCRLLRGLAARPDAAFCLLVPAEESLRRTVDRGRQHWETLEVLEQRLREYRVLAAELNVPILDGCEPVERIASTLRNAVVVHTEPGQATGK